MNLKEFNTRVDDLFRKVAIGHLTYDSLKCELRRLCIEFETALIKQGLNVDAEEIELDVVVFLCDG